MIELYVSGQSLKLYTPVIAADSLHYLTGRVHFAGSGWDGCSKWVHLARGEGLDATVYDIALADDAFDETAELNLTVGEWSVYVTGVKGSARLTTVPLVLTVKASGLIDAPLHVMPLSVAEQIDAKVATALRFASAVKAAAEAGDFNGADGRSFVIAGYYDTAEALAEAVPEPQAGEAYAVGMAAPYDVYLYDAVGGVWRNNGPVQGVKGDRGSPGVVFTPNVDASGTLTWTNDGGLENPEARNLKGPSGAAGAPGADGKSPYEAAVEAGYTGTEATFYAALVSLPYHNARHLPDGTDPITVQTGNLTDGAVTSAKLASGAVSAAYTGTLAAADWTGSAAPYAQALTVPGLLATDAPLVDVVMSGTWSTDEARDEAWGGVYRAETSADTLTVYAAEKPAVDLPIRILCVRK